MSDKDLTAIVELIHTECPKEQCGYRPAKNDSSIVCFGCSRFRKRNVDYSLIVSEKDSAASEQIQFVGSKDIITYSGDGLEARAGDIVNVSSQKKAQLLSDFPKLWKDPAMQKPKKTASKKPKTSKAKNKAKKTDKK